MKVTDVEVGTWIDYRNCITFPGLEYNHSKSLLWSSSGRQISLKKGFTLFSFFFFLNQNSLDKSEIAHVGQLFLGMDELPTASFRGLHPA